MEGLEAWDIAERCRGQVRLAPSGMVIGFDLAAVLTLGTALGYDERALAELLPAIELGMVAGVVKLRNEQHGDE